MFVLDLYGYDNVKFEKDALMSTITVLRFKNKEKEFNNATNSKNALN